MWSPGLVGVVTGSSGCGQWVWSLGVVSGGLIYCLPHNEVTYSSCICTFWQPPHPYFLFNFCNCFIFLFLTCSTINPVIYAAKKIMRFCRFDQNIFLLNNIMLIKSQANLHAWNHLFLRALIYAPSQLHVLA